jgi:hypothetical protein
MSEQLTPLATEQEVTDKIIVCIEGQDWIQDLGTMPINFNSSETEILEAIRPGIQEKFGIDIYDESRNSLYKVRKATASKNIYIIPNSVAGK